MSKYISLENLERYDAKMQEHFASFCASKEDGMWRQTEKAGAVQFWPVGNSPMEGTVEFMFKETGPASGEKGPDNPSTITGVSSVKITGCGRNLLSQNYYDQSGRESYDVTFTVNDDGSVSCSGTATDYATFRFAYYMFLPAGTYFVTGCPSGGSYLKYSLAIQRHGGNTVNDYGDGVSLVVSNPGYYYIYTSIKPGYNATGLVFNPPQLELGTTATSFEPYSGNDYTIPLGNTYYGGSIDLATGLMTVTWVSQTISGLREFTSTSSDYVRFRFSCSGYPKSDSGQYPFASNILSISYSDDYYEHIRPNAGGAVSCAITILKSRLDMSGAADPSNPTDAEWLAAGNAYFNSHPFQFVHKINHPQTVQLTPTQILALLQPDKYVPRLNTVYSDADAVQIVYQKNPVRDKFEKVSAIVAQGGNV